MSRVDSSGIATAKRTRSMSDGLRVADYAAAKRLDIGALAELGLRDARWQGASAIRIPYLHQEGKEIAVRFRIALTGDRFRWRKGDTPCLYGLHRLHVARIYGYVVLVEGESDCHAAWLHNVPALGIPGAASWRAGWAALLDGIPDVYLVVEPDQGGRTLVAKLGVSIGRRLRLVCSLGVKDLGELHLKDPEHFLDRFQVARSTAIPYVPPWRQRDPRARAWRDRRGHLHMPDLEVSL
jgi:hypothetical protein